jgi:hypothetical protein
MNHLKLLGLCALALVAAGCTRSVSGSIDEPYSKPAELNGAWRIASVSIVDNDAVSKNFFDPAANPLPVSRGEITSSSDVLGFGTALTGPTVSPAGNFDYRSGGITFTLNAAGNGGTYTTTQGTVPNDVLPASGTWSVDNAVFATEVRLVPSVGAPLTWKIFRNLAKGGPAYLSTTRSDAGSAVSYEFTFSR